MNAPRTNPHIIACRRKLRYSDEVSARAAASVICERHELVSVGIYRCKVCSGWHVSTNRRSRRWSVTAGQTVIPLGGKQ